MPSYRKKFSLYPRKVKGGKKIWYYRCYDENDERTVGRSTGQTSKVKAEWYCEELLKKGRLIPRPKKSYSGGMTFADYSENWWVWEKCQYVRGRLLSSSSQKQLISRRHADDNRRILENHILPYFQKYRISKISTGVVEGFKLALQDKGLSRKRIINILSCLRVMISEGYRLGYIEKNPFDAVNPLAVDEREGGVLTINEVRRLFDPANIEKIWQGHLLYRAINMFAAVSGARQGEILALRDEDLKDGYVHIAHSWSMKYGLGPTKTRQERDIPLPSKVAEALEPFRGTGGFVFSFDRGKSPATGNRATEYLYQAMERAGIPAEERKSRNIKFHSWRYFFNSVMRGSRIADAKVQKVTGHKTMAMTQRYTAFNLEDFDDVAKVQEELFE